MIVNNIFLGENVNIETSAHINNVRIGNNSKIAGNVKIFGSAENILVVGEGCYVGANTILEGFNAKVTIGKNVSFAQNVNLMSGSGPNASEALQIIFPIVKGEIVIGNDCWIGASSIIMPNVHLGDFCIVAANSFVNKRFPSYSIIGGTPAKLIRKLTQFEIDKIVAK
ncbi:2,3,4,5-tetrahydropyridine-2,6-dicarboxylate N-acetyltransferase [Flavobacterium bizetiae]|uniref:2,3,4,5-tetrahydropyridine-2,6-dicarboxylate N-acetyltransferase n=1 Tax=Flavobacterium bizetiae TaxID=2704140 RepID=A0A6J4GPQ9_9FLAO|nr:acyltransferase [Flavobacterium bizetiae]CAA9200250.1 2,3,4,5-tetrahydropyridine-2,6-dicarboxylate N-acetyltransferase [Flavobacterium bizetiae]CAD5344715.1 2,3,4,5-tetrahydropyridine-2,6-dicarboxylate N-acetyltransferase [Flavobacterium bizetiae]CAD5349857.1 2,3,4,5-tetrahydropyridine-2,6-dicarboxylate N-acetyltransferase [Flavobacterium bizetiae]